MLNRTPAANVSRSAGRKYLFRNSTAHLTRMEFVAVKLRKLGCALATTVFAAVAVSMLGMSPASAHTSAISGVAVCEPGSGTFSVTWSGGTDMVPDGAVATVTVISHDPAASTVPTTVTTELAQNADYSFKQEGIPNDATQAHVAVRINWRGSSTFQAEANGTVTIPGNCSPPVQPAEPTQSTPTCEQPDMTVTLPETNGVTYEASGPLTLAPGESVEITPVANEGVVLSPGAYPWTIKNDFDVASCAEPTVTPAEPTASNASCAHPDMKVTLPTTEHITYEASGPLDLKPGESVTITPTADAGFTLPEGAKATTIKNTFDASTTCSEEPEAANPPKPPKPPAPPALAHTGASLALLSIGGLVCALGGLALYGARRMARV